MAIKKYLLGLLALSTPIFALPLSVTSDLSCADKAVNERCVIIDAFSVAAVYGTCTDDAVSRKYCYTAQLESG